MIRGTSEGISGRTACGWIFDPSQPTTPQRVRIYLDDRLVMEGVADMYRDDLANGGFGNGLHGFQIVLPENELDGREAVLDVRGPDNRSLELAPKRLRLPNLVFRPLPPLASPRPVQISICAVIRNEAPYLLEWLAWHRLIGVERFHLFDNASTDGTTVMLSALAKAGVVDHVVWPDVEEGNTQVAAYIAGLGRIGYRSRWVAFIDLDEFLNPLRGETLPQILGDFVLAGGLVVPWRIFGSNNQQHWQDDLVVSRFTRRAMAENPVNSFVKTIIQTHVIDRPLVHTPVLKQGNLVDEHGVVAGMQGHPDHHMVPLASRLVLNHYFTKSREEWQLKRARGKATHPRGAANAFRDDSEFATHDFNDVEDTALANRANEIKLEMARLTRLLSQK